MPKATKPTPPSLDKLLAPWRNRAGKLLGGGILDPCDSFPLEPTLWCEWSPFDDEIDVTTKQIECFELLDLVAQIDLPIFQRYCRQLCKHTAREPYVSSATRLGYVVQVEEYTNFDVILETFGWAEEREDTPSKPSDQFTTAKRALEERLLGEKNRSPIPVRFAVSDEPDYDDDDAPPPVLDQVYALAVRQHQQRTCATSGQRLRFELTGCDLVLQTSELTNETLQRILAIQQCGVAISGLVLSGTQLPAALDASVVQQSMESLFQPPPSSSPCGIRRSSSDGVVSLTVEATIDERIHGPLCSALMVSESVRSVAIDSLRSESARYAGCELWKSLACTLFSPMASHRVETLEIHADNLTTQDIMAVETILHHSNPVHAALGRGSVDTDTTKTHRIVDLGAGSSVWLSPLDGSGVAIDDLLCHPQDLVLRADYSRVLVLRDGGDAGKLQAVEVLLPGCGPCWVQRSSILSEMSLPPTLSHAARVRPFPVVVLRSITEQSSDAGLAFLRLVGHGVTRLEIRDAVWKPVLPTHWLRSALAACPNLSELMVVNTTLSNINAILDAASSPSSPSILLKTLCLERCSFFGDYTSSLRPLFQLLSDRDQPLARSLTHLTLTTARPGFSQKTEWERVVLDAWLAMLATNRVLALNRWHAVGTAARRKHYMGEFLRFDGQPMPGVRGAPLALRCKLALLSCVSAAANGHEHDALDVASSSRFAIGSDVLSLIMQFAAESVARRCEYVY